MKFSVIGAGNAGQAMAAHLTMLGYETVLFSRNKAKLDIINSKGITLTNAIEKKVKVNTTESIKDAVSFSDFIMVATAAYGHQNIANLIKDYLKDNQVIIILPGYWGSLEFKNILSDIITNKNITIGETDSMIYTCRTIETGLINLKSIKKKVSFSCLPSSSTKEIFKKITNIYPHMTLSNSVLETTFNNFNPILHTPLTILNASRIDFEDEFMFYPQGASPRSVDYIENLDDERLAIGNTLNIKLFSTLELLNRFYGRNDNNLYDGIHKNRAYQAEKSPPSLDYRYVTEEIPFGLVPLSELGKMCGLKTPYIDTLIDMASLVMQTDFRQTGLTLNKLGIKTISELKSLL